jgi:CBS-domain-containing membrane protein
MQGAGTRQDAVRVRDTTTRPDVRLERWTQISAFVAVPALLAVLTATQRELQNSETQFLVLPPLAVIIFLLFREPFGPWANLRSIVILPCIGAATGELTYHFLGMTAIGIAVDTLVVLAFQSLLRSKMPPALALSVLAMLLHAESWTYFLGVAEATCIIAIAFSLWRRFLIAPLLEKPLSAPTDP